MYVVTNDCKKHHIDAITHGRKWVAGDAKTINGSIAKEPLSNQRWHQRCPLGEKVFPGNREFQDMTSLEAFLMMMTPDELDLILELTNKNFESSGKKELSLQELLRWFGVIILMSASNFRGDCRTLWEGGGSVSKYLPPVDLKATGMSCNCWEDIWYAIRWSGQPSEKPPEMSSERYRWLLVDDFITNFNAHHASTFYPGVELEADESMVPWYGHGGGHINIGLPHYVAMDCKPDNGGEIQTLADVSSGILICLKVVKSADKEKAIEKDLDLDLEEAAYGKGTRVLLELMKTWLSPRTHTLPQLRRRSRSKRGISISSGMSSSATLRSRRHTLTL
jgi:hypothetical protein